MEPFSSLEGFDWDEANLTKNWVRHRVSPSECEQVFFNRPLVIAEDVAHSRAETRYYVLGKTDAERLLFIVFTIRRGRIRIISARDMKRKERRHYHAEAKKDAEIQE